MNPERQINKKQSQSQDVDPGPYLQWNFKFNEVTGKNEFQSITLSDGSPVSEETAKAAMKKASGTSDLVLGEKILKKIAYGMTMEEMNARLNDVCSTLSVLQPQDSTETLLFGQFLALQDSGMKCLRLANISNQGFYHVERLFVLANKLFNTANQTMQTVLKYRSGGQQTVQVIHMHNEGQAIVAQNLSSTPAREGTMEKNKN